jgi:EpsI family protein
MGGAGLLTISQPSPVPLLQSFDRFPLQLGAWQGRRMFIDQEIFQKTEADAYLDAEYTSPGQVPVSLYIAHYEKQASAGGLGHNPGVCMTGSGWITKISGKEEIAPGLQVNYMLLERAGVSQPLLVYFWNIHQGEWLALSSDRIYKLHTIFKAIKRHRTDWALIRLITPLNKDMPAAQKRLKSFAHLLMPVLPQFIKSDNLLDNNATIPNLDSQ